MTLSARRGTKAEKETESILSKISVRSVPEKMFKETKNNISASDDWLLIFHFFRFTHTHFGR